MHSEPFWPSFRRLFNLISVALVFWLCFVLVLGHMVMMLPQMGLAEWVMELAYLTRQFLVSGLWTLLAVALASAALPEHLSSGKRWLAVLGLLASAGLISGSIRLAISPYQMHGWRDCLIWFCNLIALWTWMGSLAYLLARSVHRQAQTRRRLAQQVAEREALGAAALEARLAALQAQIEPHFLFNTLANVRRLGDVDPERGRRMLASLLDYLRGALPAMRRASTTLSEELELVQAYLSVLQQRMGQRLRFSVDLPDSLAQAAIPPLILPTLVENAIRHGLAPLPEGGTVRIAAAHEDGQIVMSVSDDGAGFQAASGSGVGLANTRARLSALFGQAASLSLRANQPRGVVAEVRLPYRLAARAEAAS